MLTVHEKYYEEAPDHNLEKLLPSSLRIEKANAFKVTNPRLIGDIGLRAFFQLYKIARQMIRVERIDFLYIPIPSFYCALLGRWLHHSTGIKYGIDYIDPWVHNFPGAEKLFSRHWFSKKLARLLETIAVKKVSLITGVAEGYYAPVLDRNPHLRAAAVYGAMPYGGEQHDHDVMHTLNLKPYLFEKKKGKIQLVYAGAMLPKAYEPLAAIFKSIKTAPEIFQDVEFHFIGTGNNTNNEESFKVKSLAEKCGLWKTIIYEYPQRIPYLEVLAHLEAADGIFILGSTESHYTPSKTYQAILAGKPIFAVMHKESSALALIRGSGSGIVLGFAGNGLASEIRDLFPALYKEFLAFKTTFQPVSALNELFSDFSARSTTEKLAELLKII